MSLHPGLPTSPHEVLLPEQRWFPADESLRASSYEKLLPPLVAKIRTEVKAWREAGWNSLSPRPGRTGSTTGRATSTT